MTTTLNPLDKPVSALTLPHFLKNALSEAGYKTLRDLEPISAGDLSIELGIGLAQAEDVLRSVRALSAGPSSSPKSPVRHVGSPRQAITAADLLAIPAGTRSRCLSTGCLALDGLLSNFTRVDLPANPSGHRRSTSSDPQQTAVIDSTSGIVRGLVHGTIPPGSSIEVAGPPGVGKSAIAIAAILNACLVAELKHDAGGVLVVDTEGGLIGERLWRAADEVTANFEGMATKDLLSRIQYLRVEDTTQLLATLETIDLYLDPMPLLVVVDTLSFHLRHSTLPLSGKGRAMDLYVFPLQAGGPKLRYTSIKGKIRELTEVYKCSVLVTNQLSTKLFTADNKPANFESGEKAILVPQLGDAWCLPKKIRMVIFRGSEKDGLRYAHATDGNGNRDDLPWACFDVDLYGLPSDVPGTAQSEKFII